MQETIPMPGGRLDSATEPAFEYEMIAAPPVEPRSLLFDPASIGYVSSGRLRVLPVATRRVRSAGGRIALCALAALRQAAGS